MKATATDLPAMTRLQRCLWRHGRSATAYQILNPGIRLWMPTDLDAAAGYVDEGRFRVVAGVPVCDVAVLPVAMARLERDARRAGRKVCYFGVEAWAVEAAWEPRRYARILLGGQPAWDPHAWAGIFSHHASLRAQLNRARNKSVRVEEGTVSGSEDYRALHACLEEWLDTRGLPPMHFLVEPETLACLHQRRLFVATRQGAVIGFLVLSPVPPREGWLVEQIVRGRGAVNGTSELLLDTAVRRLASEGNRYVTLGLAALSRRAGLDYRCNPPWLRLVFGWTRAHGARFYNFRGLDDFKAKFEPQRWEPIYALANEPVFSMRAFYAIAAAFSSGSPLRLVGRASLRALRQETRWFTDWLLGRG